MNADDSDSKFLTIVETLRPEIDHLRVLINKVDPSTEDFAPLLTIAEFLPLLRKGLIQQKQEAFFYLFRSLENVISQIIKEKSNLHTGMCFVFNIFEFIEEGFSVFLKNKDVPKDVVESVEKIRDLFFSKQDENKSISAQERALADRVFREVTFQEFGSVTEDNRLMLEDFLHEMTEVVEEVEESLIAAEDSPENLDINLVFRALHGVKGTASFMNLKSIQKISHAGENLLDSCRSGSQKVSPSCLKILWNLVDILKLLFFNLKMKMAQAKDGKPRFPSVVQLDPLLNKIDKFLQGEEEDLTEMGQEIINQSNNRSGSQPEGGDSPDNIDETIRVSGGKLDELYSMVGELTVLANLIKGDPAITALNFDTKSKIEKIGTVTDRLRGKVVDIHMLSAQGLFQRLKRLLGKLARQCHKKINVITEGENIEIHKSISESLYTPLVHMLRNSVDHGIELPSERISAGKQEAGTIEIMVSTNSEKLIFKITDDGRGMDADKIFNRAVEKGLVSSDKVMETSDILQLIFSPGFSTAQTVSDISGRGVGMDVVKTTIERFGGTIDIDTELGKGCSFLIQIPLLSNTSIIEGFVVKSQQSFFIFPIISVEHTFILKAADVQYAKGQQGEFAIHRKNLIPLIHLSKFFDLPDQKENEEVEGNRWKKVVMVTRVGGKIYGMLVDDLISRQQLVLEDLMDRFDLCGISGGAVLANGHFGMVLDPKAIVKAWI